ncbi:MAG TPA: gamma-butyrobetaine hydroxylase-like domain-containing protein [Gammaproteobacteria bacterium]|nr:gamma-butyrobetaine hydroxylase-like domain-containing protein [Gammaproteobacteria bacterium]
MTQEKSPTPRQLTLHKRSKTLEIEFENGERFILPCDYLRASSPSADTRFNGSNVNILAIEPVGNYAVKLIFSDGHRTGIYSWTTLYTLGVEHSKNGKT